MRRRAFLAASAAATALAAPALAQGSARVLRVIPSANLTSLDPIWTTAPATKNHGYLIYDQIAAVDFHLRAAAADGGGLGGRRGRAELDLRTPPGPPLPRRGAGARRGLRRLHPPLAGAGRLRPGARRRDGRAGGAGRPPLPLPAVAPLPAAARALGKSNSSQCFIMPERVAATDPGRQISDTTGSGPFRFLRDEWVAGARAAYARHEGYVPRDEPVSSIAGGRVARVDRVEWTVIPDAATASGGAQGRRAGLLGAAAARPTGVAPARPQPGGADARPVRHLRHAALQPPPTALRQRGAAPRRGHGGGPGGLHAGGRRRRAGRLGQVPRLLRLQHAARFRGRRRTC